MAYWGSLETHKPRYFYPRQLLYLHVQFTSQSAPDIHRKLHQLEKGPKTPQWDFLEIAFKVFNNSESEVAQSCPILWDPMDCRLPHPWNFLGKSTGVGCYFLLQGIFSNREEEAKKEKEKERKAKYALFAAAIQEKNSTPLARQPRPTPMGPNPPGPCFRCNQTGHWAKSWPSPWPPTKPCHTCKQWGHWKMDWLSSDATHQISGSTPGPTTMGQGPDSGGPWHPRPWLLGWEGNWPNFAWVIPVMESKLQTPSLSHTDGLRALSNWHSGQTQSLIPNRHWSSLFTFNPL